MRHTTPRSSIIIIIECNNTTTTTTSMQHNHACPAPPTFTVKEVSAASLAEQLKDFAQSQLKHQQTRITYQSGKRYVVRAECCWALLTGAALSWMGTMSWKKARVMAML